MTGWLPRHGLGRLHRHRAGEVFALELNTIPGMSWDSNFLTAAGLCGLGPADVVTAILREALTWPRYDSLLPVPAFPSPARNPPHADRQRGPSVSRVHQVPMCRQRIDPGEWDAHGGGALGDRAEWSDRACGMAALRMILLAYRRPAPPLTELVALGVPEGALTGRGWLHAGIARLAERFGIPARAQAVAAPDLPGHLAAAPVIVSVTEKFPDDGRKGGHLVVARGYHAAPARRSRHPLP